MHLLVTESGAIDDGAEPRDLRQTPGAIVVLSSADTELALLAGAHGALAAVSPQPTMRLVNLMQLKHNFSVDLYAEKTLTGARIVVLRLLGGRSYWPYGLERLTEMARDGAFQLVVLPGDDKPDLLLEGLSTVDDTQREALWAYLREGGTENASGFLLSLAAMLNGSAEPPPARPLMKAGLYWPGAVTARLETIRQHWRPGWPAAAIIFYRALMQSGDLAAVDALIAGLAARGLNPLPVFVTSLREEICIQTLRALFRQAPPDIILNSTAFAANIGAGAEASPFAGLDAMVLQIVCSGETEEAWASRTRGLSPHYIAMHVALPEIDGRVLTRAISFKSDSGFDAATQHYLTRAVPKPDRVDFVADLTAAWVRLRRTPPPGRKWGLILANYPNRDARLANGVGLDTPQSAIEILTALEGAGYAVGDIPADGNALIAALREGPTNAGLEGRAITERLPLADYLAGFAALPERIRAEITARWGPPDADPHFTHGAFAIPALRLGNVAIGVQPARGYNLDPKGSYHDPALVPPHSYFAFYIWLRAALGAHAVIHLGKHGNLEWLPGKALALSAECYPEAALGPLPNIYPFIVNDPGEGSQAKRRTSAVIIDHLTPPLTRAETYGPLKELEALVDEYFEAANVDEPRRVHLAGEILATSARLGLDRDCGIDPTAPQETALAALDNHLCELKEMQIRDGLHIFGRSPEGGMRTDLLVALARVPRGDGAGGNASLIGALAADLGLDGFDPLACTLGGAWSGARPDTLAALSNEPWRTAGDTVERLEILAQRLVSGEAPAAPGTRSQVVLDEIRATLAPSVEACGTAEIAGILTALNGRFVPPGPSGAPTRGRPDVLPTGRNFYSLDGRTVPTPAAWELGRKSADLVIARYLQDHGDWPRALAISAWGTANMRTGGDDVAQALALMGVRPRWEPASRRVTGFEIIPLVKLERPRVDVTFRVSGFFRDAFPAQMDLLDSAVRAVAALDEAADENPIAAHVAVEAAKLIAIGAAPDAARRLASARIFGSKPGAYGAGLQTLIDESLWRTEADFAESYIQWGQYAYGAGLEGRPERGALERRLAGLDAIVHNQDNHEHDILDSDDYYQFEGGLAASVKALKGAAVRVYHGDHSRPERPVIRSLEEEIGRIVRGRAANPKWIAGVMRHGYKGAFEIAATVDYLFAFAATTDAVGDHHFEALYDAYIGDDRVRSFLAENNDAALTDIAARFSEAIERGLWSPRSNSAGALLGQLAKARQREVST
ncbi:MULTISPECIES: cobaltochelatase subunit CobN [Rhodomicrobium]|uniref:cobaltochelatase subunit CobN n=1 Tax=Rhodomicrobium TaxID=1068 RepID=UPI000B4AD7F3|nr:MULTISPECIES: cobaltochelatase subunit CobN [Rhodomicrobium]